MVTQDEFDPIRYIERAMTDDRPTEVEDPESSGIDLEVPSIGEFLRGAKPHGPRQRKSNDRLSAPRPRKAKAPQEPVPHLDDLNEVWAMLPKAIDFLSMAFDDTVTANYYTGDFKESRPELIRRLLDPELNLEEVSRILGVCPATVRRYTNREWLEHHRTKGGQRRFRLSGVVKFIDQHGRAPKG